MSLLIKALHADTGLQALFFPDGSQGGEVQVHRDEVPAVITYPFIYLAEASESEDLRDSESIQYPQSPYDRAARCQLHGDAVSSTASHGLPEATFPWAIVQRVRQALIDEAPNPFLSDNVTQDAADKFDIRVLAITRQNLLPTGFKDEMARKVYQSTQTFLLYGKKLGGY